MAGLKGKTGIWKRNADQRQQILCAGFSTRFHKGQKLSEETRAKMSKSRIGVKKKPEQIKYGSDSSGWKGGLCSDRCYLSFIKNRRNRLKKIASGSHTYGEWETLKAQYNLVCLSCGKSEPTIKLTEDHIIPLSKGGSDNIENIQPLCSNCNSKKHTKIINYKLKEEM